MNKKQLVFLLLSVSLQTTHPAIVQAAPIIPDEFKYEDERYYYDSYWKNDERTLKADLDYDGKDEIVVSFAAGIKVKSLEEGGKNLLDRPFYQIYKEAGKEYKLVKTIIGNQYLGEISVEDLSKDGRKQLVIWSHGGAHHTDLYIYEWRDGRYKRIFEDGSACEVRLEFDKKIPEIWIGREQWDKEGWSYSDEPFWEVYKWNGKKFEWE